MERTATRIRLPALLFGLALLLPTWAEAQFFGPRIDGFSPAFGEPGTQVTLSGSFSTSISPLVAFGSDQTFAEVISKSATTIVVIVPTSAHTGPISITQSFTAASAQHFAVAPRVQSFRRQGSQNVAVAAIGDSVQVEGANFVSGTTMVKVGSTASASVSVTANTQLFFTVPQGAETGPITVQTSAGLFTTSSNLIVTGSAVITDFSPATGVGGAQVTINGGDFTGATAVTFNGVAALFNVTSPSQIIATAPTNAGSGPIVVTTPNGNATSFTPFTSVNLAPVVTGFTPASGKAGDPIVITGLNLQGVTNVAFNGVTARFDVTADTQISAIVPTNITSGPITLANQHSSVATDASFGVEPVITGFDPVAGVVGSSVTIHGQNLLEVTNVSFGGVAASFVHTGPDQIHATVPFGATNAPLSVIAPSGANTSSTSFTVTFGVPLITGFTPGSGLAGVEVILSGLHFSGATNVTFNGVASTSFGVTSDSQIAVFTPAAAGTGPITVFGPAGTNQSTNLFYFPPRLTSFTPHRAAAGIAIAITGTNFTDAVALEFSGPDQTRIPAAFTIDSDRRITALIPTNVVNGPLTLTTPGGKFITTSNFTILPRIDDFTPRLAPVGANVTITGQNFEKLANVRFNGINANYTFLSTSNLTATVPLNATTGPVSLLATEGDTVSSTDVFVVTTRSNLRVAQSNLPGLALEAEPIDILITLTNLGPSIVTEVLLTHSLPSVFTVLSAESTLGASVVSNRTVRCSIPVLTNGHTAALTVKVTALASGSFPSTATVSAREGDTDLSDNTSIHTIPVIREGDRLLSIQNLGAERVKVSWNFSAGRFELQAAGDLLSSETPWLTLTSGVFNVTQNFAIFHVFTNHLTQSRRFFRLIRE